MNRDSDYEARRNLEPATGLGWEAPQYAAGGSVCIRVLEGTVTVWISPGAGLEGSSGGVSPYSLRTVTSRSTVSLLVFSVIAPVNLRLGAQQKTKGT